MYHKWVYDEKQSIHGADIRQCQFPGDQNRAEDRHDEEAHNPNEEGQYAFFNRLVPTNTNTNT